MLSRKSVRGRRLVVREPRRQVAHQGTDGESTMTVSGDAGTISALLTEERRFPPPAEFAAQANANDPSIYERADADFEAFWAEQAGNLDWFTPFSTVLEWSPPKVKWFSGGQLNASYNCVDRRYKSWRRNKAAIIWE